MPNIGPVELIVILVIALIVIGPGRLPDVGAALGKSIKEFRKASSDITDATRVDAPAQTAAAPAAPLPPAATAPAPNTLTAESAPNTLSETPAPPAAPAPTPELVQPAPATPTSPSPIAVPHVDDDAGRPA
jgi:sec-independent protein translocase protein TatA